MAGLLPYSAKNGVPTSDHGSNKRKTGLGNLIGKRKFRDA